MIHNPNPLIPPIFEVDEYGWVSEWNVAITKLTRWHRDEVLDKMLLVQVFDSSNASRKLQTEAELHVALYFQKFGIIVF
jgi:phytochrome A